jgi:hypothetical protein
MKEKRIGNRKLRMTILEGVERERHRDGWIPEPKVLPLLSMMFTDRNLVINKFSSSQTP